MRKNYVDTNPWKSRQGLFTVKQPETGKSETAGSSFAKSAVEIQLANNACSETADKGNIQYSDFLTPMSLSLFLKMNPAFQAHLLLS